MKSLRLAFLLTIASCLASFAAEGWNTDYKAALAEAAKSNKHVLINFTGSDWCGWCIKLKKDTFSQPEFQKYAADNLVLVELDFPQKPLSAELTAQNEKLQAEYKVDGFPTLVILDSKGKEIARNAGYLAGGPAAFISWADKAK